MRLEDLLARRRDPGSARCRPAGCWSRCGRCSRGWRPGGARWPGSAASPSPSGTSTVGMFGPPLTTRSTAEFFDTDAPALGSVDRTSPLVVLLACDGAGAHGEVVVVQGLRGLAGGQPDHVGHGDVAAEHPHRAQEEEGDDGQGHQEHDQQNDEVAGALLALEVLPAGRAARRRGRPWCGRSSWGRPGSPRPPPSPRSGPGPPPRPAARRRSGGGRPAAPRPSRSGRRGSWPWPS